MLAFWLLLRLLKLFKSQLALAFWQEVSLVIDVSLAEALLLAQHLS
jgi:hypothetical protein